MIIVGVYLISNGDLTMGGLIAATMLSGRAIGPLVQLSLLSTRYNQAKSSMTIIEQVMSMLMNRRKVNAISTVPSFKARLSWTA